MNYLIIIVYCFIAYASISFCFKNNHPLIGVIITILFLTITIIKYEIDKKKEEKLDKKHNKYRELIEKKYDAFIEQLNTKYPDNIVYKPCSYFAFSKNEIIGYSIPEIIKIKNDILNEDFENFIKEYNPTETLDFSIPIDDIIYFYSSGDVTYTESLMKTKGTPESTVIGGIMGGLVGAFVGSQMSVKTVTKKHDDRKTIVRTRKEEYKLDYRLFDVLMKIIPEKEYKYQMYKEKNGY